MDLEMVADEVNGLRNPSRFDVICLLLEDCSKDTSVIINPHLILTYALPPTDINLTSLSIPSPLFKLNGIKIRAVLRGTGQFYIHITPRVDVLKKPPVRVETSD